MRLPRFTYVTGDALSQVITLLHELRHAMNEIFGAGTSMIGPDGSDTPADIQASKDNTDLVNIACVRETGDINQLPSFRARPQLRSRRIAKNLRPCFHGAAPLRPHRPVAGRATLGVNRG
jgi:hypothetical protein